MNGKKYSRTSGRVWVKVICLLAAVAAAAVALTAVAGLRAGAPAETGAVGQTAAVSDSAGSTSETQSAVPVQAPVDPVKRVRFSAVGDDLIHGTLFLQARQRAAGTDKDYDFTFLYERFAPFLQDYDINFINQETLVTDELAPSHYPCFCSPGEVGRETYRLGWRIFGTSNNHIYDKGTAGLQGTLDFWAAMPEDAITVGLYKDEDYDNIRMNEKNGITFAYLAYTQYTNGIPTPADAPAHIIYTSQEDVIQHQIETAKQKADVVVVSVHWGVEDDHNAGDAQKELARKMGNWGADVIIGTHPHVIQTMELLTNDDGSHTLVNYSLGNFVSAQSRPDEMIGSALTFDVCKAPDGSISLENILVHPTVTHYGSNYSNVQVLLLKDYTAEEAAAHGVRSAAPGFSLDYIWNVVETYIPEEYLCRS